MSRTISIIVPTCNAADSIDVCLESLERQTFQNFNLSIIDACSNDRTKEIVLAYRDKIGREVDWASELDNGVYDAMNKGLSIAKGEWLYFMGADDELYDEKVLADVVDAISDGSTDLLYGDVVSKNSGQQSGGKWTLDRILFSENLCQQSIFYRREIFNKLGMFSNRYPVWADWEFNIRCFRHEGMRKKYINRVIAIYNDISGLSCEEDPIFRRELPVTLLQETERLKSELRMLKNKRSYYLGKKIFGWLD